MSMLRILKVNPDATRINGCGYQYFKEDEGMYFCINNGCKMCEDKNCPLESANLYTKFQTDIPDGVF